MTEELRTNQPPMDPRFMKLVDALAEGEGRPYGHVAASILKTLDGEPAPRHLHFITHTHDREMITSHFECRGDETSPCHQYPDCGCEVVCEHPRVSHAECMVKPWMDDVCAGECFDPREPTPVRDGPITAWFDGDCYAWDYAEPEGMTL